MDAAGAGAKGMVTLTIAYALPERQACARAARGEIEAALDGAGWPWSRRFSLWIDVLVIVEEGAGS